MSRLSRRIPGAELRRGPDPDEAYTKALRAYMPIGVNPER